MAEEISGIEVDFVKPHYDLDKEDKRLVGLEMSVSLVPELEGHLPEPVEQAWKFLREGGCRRIDVIDIPAQTVDLSVSKAIGKARHLSAVEITHAQVSLIEARGSGDARDTVRFSFRIRTPVTKEISDFADFAYGNTIWLHMQDAQLTLAMPAAVQ